MYDAGCRNLKNFDLIHERFNAPAMGGALASRKLGIPYILEVNAELLEQRAFKGVPERGFRRLLCIYATRLALKTAARLICTSAVVKRSWTLKWGVDASKIFVLPCAADVEMFRRKYDSDLVRKQLGLAAGPVVMWVGGYYPWQDLDLLAESFSRVLDLRPDAKLVMVGDGETRAAFERKVAQRGVQESVVVVGAVPFRRIPELLSAADVAVSPSPSHLPGSGGTPMKLAEYMAAGKAIVATRLDQISALIEDQQTGLLVPPEDVDAFTEAVVTLLNNPLQRDRLGENARREAVEHYSWEQYAKRLEEIYLDVLEDRT
jgi:glycosyltransferase involved in cell wall biosynthesis